MKIVAVSGMERIERGLICLTNEFSAEYPYYKTWIEKNMTTFQNGSRIIYELREADVIVGYMMVNVSDKKIAKLNGIHVLPEHQKHGYARAAMQQLLDELKEQGYEYVYVQTRLHNKIVVHMFEVLHFHIIGMNYHNIEKQENWVAVFDLQRKDNIAEMKGIADKIYPGFKAV